MDSRQRIIDMLSSLSEDQLQKVINCMKEISLDREQLGGLELDEEQRNLLNLLNHTVDTGRGDFAEKHDHYLCNKDES